jgi:hypothetical protein
MPFVALLSLVHLRNACFVFVLGRRGGRYQGRINDGSLPEHQTVVCEEGVDLIHNLWSQQSFFEQMPEVFQCCGVRYSLRGQVDTNESRY